jgi:hypothetical protein
MTATEFETLRADLLALRADIEQQRADALVFRTDVNRRFFELETKLDTKPSIATLYQAVATLAFGIGAVVTSTVVVLKNIGLMG